MGKIYFSTVVSVKYVYKMAAMYKTLEHHCSNFGLFILCTDGATYEILSRLSFKNAIFIKLDDVEDDEILKAKSNRSVLEYAWTLKSVMLHYIMHHFPDAEYYAHIDADICFFSDPNAIFLEAPAASLFITDHHNSERFQHYYALSGRYNTGFVGCRNCHEALKAVVWWKKMCLQCCTSEMNVKKGLYGDQKYIEAWPALFRDVHVVHTKGANVALWNVEQYQISLKDHHVFVDGDRLIFYHFSGFSILNFKEFNLSWFYEIKNPKLIEYVYLPYMHLLAMVMEEIKKLFPTFCDGFAKRIKAFEKHYYRMGNS